ncbi:MAG: Holliday junction resolvase RuvX [Actinomycetes bacterium]
MNRILALDHGSARCGVALSDPSGTIVTPLDSVAKPESEQGLDRISMLCRERDVTRVVVGLPLSLNGSESKQTAAARRFAQLLEAQLDGVAVELMDERLTTSEARNRGGEADEDSRAAAVLLERWLEQAEGRSS